ncbi:alkaline phosphatase family protein [Arthrobacter rhombi]|uniref:alkaline phosphatase family protein n=1 Tax=Arthrobacter rhombi TaxID=71253 RepID=UPI0031D95D9F
MQRRRGIRRGTVAVGIAATLLAAGCSAADPGVVSSSGAAATSLRPSSPGSLPAATARAAVGHIVIIVEENHSVSTILGDAAAPYINSLADRYSLATNYHAIAHPSLPNYLALMAGTTAGITTDCTPGPHCVAGVPNITDALERSGRTWKMYAEGMPAPCTAANSGRYAVRHNPFMYFPGVTSDPAACAQHVVPFTQLARDLKTAASLPDFVFISPDTCNDMHDCPVATGDAWLAREVPKILDSPAFTRQNSLLVLTWDEDDHTDRNTVATLFAGPAARRGATFSRLYDHYSLLHTVEDLWDLPPLTANDRDAPVMGDLLR